jgi:hypothetical protein|tara:strand:- start:693 stop:971 length:279 start_codon:yes stop_codon:yes gene_type:complete
MTHNELRKGMRVQLTPIPTISNLPRFAIVMDNMKGITRMVHIEENNGYFGDMGSVYVNEIEYVLFDNDMPEPVEISEAHQNKLDSLLKIHWG